MDYERSNVQLNGHKLYRNLWITIGKEQYEMEGRFGFPEDQLSEAQLKIINALAHGDGITITPDGVVTAIERNGE